MWFSSLQKKLTVFCWGYDLFYKLGEETRASSKGIQTRAAFKFHLWAPPRGSVPLILRHGRVLPVFLTKSSGFGLLRPWRSPITYPFPSSQVLLPILLLVQLRPFQTLSVQTLAKVCGRREMYGQSTPSGSLPFSSCKGSSASFLPWHSLASHQTHWCLHLPLRRNS